MLEGNGIVTGFSNAFPAIVVILPVMKEYGRVGVKQVQIIVPFWAVLTQCATSICVYDDISIFTKV